jgi:aryl-alcohol dehydrogenase-like predicted oxidoreductase
MQKRRLGRTEHESTAVIFGGAALASVSQKEADQAMALVLRHGVNHIDVAPSYGEAELRLGPWMERHRPDFFLACKTEKRTKREAAEALRRSLERLRVDHVDLYQLHGVTELEDLEAALGPGGAMEAILEGREEGLLRFIGITGHCAATQVEALKRFDFDTIMFPLNFVLRAHRDERNDWEELLKMAKDRDVGVMTIKAIAKGPWPTEARPYNTWYEPFDDQGTIDRALWFVLSQDVTAAVAPAEVRLIPKVVDAAERFRPLSEEEQDRLVATGTQFRPLFVD